MPPIKSVCTSFLILSEAIPAFLQTLETMITFPLLTAVLLNKQPHPLSDGPDWQV